MKKHILLFIITFTLMNKMSNIYSFGDIPYMAGGTPSFEDFVRLYDNTEGGVRHPWNKYEAGFLYGPFAPLAWGIAGVYDLQSQVASRNIDKSLRGGAPNRSLIRNIRHQRRGHLFTVISEKNIGLLRLLLEQEGYKTRLNMVERGWRGKHTPVTKAATEGWNEGLKVMLENGGDPHTQIGKGSKKTSLVRVLAEKKQLVGLGMLLKSVDSICAEDKSFIMRQRDVNIFKTVGENLEGARYDSDKRSLTLPSDVWEY